MRLIIGVGLTCFALIACKPGPSEGTLGTADESSGESTAGQSTGSSNPSDPTTGASEASADTGGGNSNSGTTTGMTGESSTGPGSDPSGSEGDTLTTGLGDGCEIFTSEDECAQDKDCMAIVGEAQDFEGCTPGKQFLACVAAMPCDAVITTVCRDGSPEVYELASGCIPEGFSQCDGPGQVCAGSPVCADITDPDACEAAGCALILGAPHVFKDNMECVDQSNPEPLGCFDPKMPCPPVVATVCPEGQKEPAFDVASGCIPKGFEDCQNGFVPDCT